MGRSALVSFAGSFVLSIAVAVAHPTSPAPASGDGVRVVGHAVVAASAAMRRVDVTEDWLAFTLTIPMRAATL